jgi:hypothetical protein
MVRIVRARRRLTYVSFCSAWALRAMCTENKLGLHDASPGEALVCSTPSQAARETAFHGIPLGRGVVSIEVSIVPSFGANSDHARGFLASQGFGVLPGLRF